MTSDRLEQPMALFAHAGAPATVVRLRPQAIIFGQGANADSMFYLQRGRVKLTVVCNRGREAVVAILSDGAMFGESSLLNHAMFRETATALTECSIAVLKARQVRTAVRQNPALSEVLIQSLLLRTARIEEDLVDQLLNSCENRLARTLIRLTEHGSNEIVDGVSQETLAHLVGATRSRISFFMNKFRRLGYVEYLGPNKNFRVHLAALTKVLQSKDEAVSMSS